MILWPWLTATTFCLSYLFISSHYQCTNSVIAPTPRRIWNVVRCVRKHANVQRARHARSAALQDAFVRMACCGAVMEPASICSDVSDDLHFSSGSVGFVYWFSLFCRPHRLMSDWKKTQMLCEQQSQFIYFYLFYALYLYYTRILAEATACHLFAQHKHSDMIL